MDALEIDDMVALGKHFEQRDWVMAAMACLEEAGMSNKDQSLAFKFIWITLNSYQEY